MKNYFSGKISQEHSEKLWLLALELGIPPENIVINKNGCDVLSLGVYLKFNDPEALEEFRKQSKEFIIEEW